MRRRGDDGWLRRALTGPAVLAALLAPGCGPGDRGMGTVSGRVTLRGTPVFGASVAFLPADGPGTPATGTTDFDGSYALQTRSPGDGARVGEYRVTISARRTSGMMPLAGHVATKKAKTVFLVPAKYGAAGSSRLTATVRPGANAISFALD